MKNSLINANPCRIVTSTYQGPATTTAANTTCHHCLHRPRANQTSGIASTTGTKPFAKIAAPKQAPAHQAPRPVSTHPNAKIIPAAKNTANGTSVTAIFEYAIHPAHVPSITDRCQLPTIHPNQTRNAALSKPSGNRTAASGPKPSLNPTAPNQ